MAVDPSTPKTIICSNGNHHNNNIGNHHGHTPTRFISLLVCLGLAARTIWQSLYLTGATTTAAVSRFSTSTTETSSNSNSSWTNSIVSETTSYGKEQLLLSSLGHRPRIFQWSNEWEINEDFSTAKIAMEDNQSNDDDFLSTLLSIPTTNKERVGRNQQNDKSSLGTRILEYPMSSNDVNSTMTKSLPNSFREFERAFYEECKPIIQSTQANPTCNSIHELNFASSHSSISLLSMAGSWRSVWKIESCKSQQGICDGNQTNIAAAAEHVEQIPLTLKVLQIDREINEESFTIHAVDSLVMDRLTASRHVVTNFAFCATSVVTAFASNTARQLLKDSKITSLTRLRVARDLARGLADLHASQPLSWNKSKSNNMESKSSDSNQQSFENSIAESKPEAIEPESQALFSHHDINIANLLQIYKPGSPITADSAGRNETIREKQRRIQQYQETINIQWNDFNLGIWLREPSRTANSSGMQSHSSAATKPSELSIESTNGNDCLVPVRYESPLWRSPEEISNTSSIRADQSDIYSFGNILYTILTKHQPWTHLENPTKPNLEDVANSKVKGLYPRLPSKYYNESSNMSNDKSKDGDSQLEKFALYEAIQACYRFDPIERLTAYELANALSTAYDMILNERLYRKQQKQQKLDNHNYQSDPKYLRERIPPHSLSYDEIQRLFQKGR